MLILGYASVFNFLILLICIFGGVEGAIWLYVFGICRLLKMFVRVFICSPIPILMLTWCIQRIYMVEGSIRGLFRSDGIVGSLYISVFVGMYIIA